ncbi:MAG TPA: hypothetical protein VKA49_09770 [Flavitalea sp.]|nr:hypothetical protein [Flavitalea sp.]
MLSEESKGPFQFSARPPGRIESHKKNIAQINALLDSTNPGNKARVGTTAMVIAD